MARKTAVNFDDEIEAALPEPVVSHDTNARTSKRSPIAEVTRRRCSRALLDLIAFWEIDAGPIDTELLTWADSALDRQRLGH